MAREAHGVVRGVRLGEEEHRVDPEDTSVWADRSRGFSFFSSFSVRWLGAVWLGCAATCSEVGSGSVGAATAWDASS